MHYIKHIILYLIAVNAYGDLIADFEGNDYGNWKVEGSAFGEKPARGTLRGQGDVDGFKGKGLVNSYLGGDNSTGKLTSPEFTLSKKYLTFLMGGGGWKGETCMNLVIEGKSVLSATGPNVVPGGSENLEFKYWDLSQWAGKTARLEIVDSRKGCWGHINVDHIELRDDIPPQPKLNVTHPMKVSDRYMMLPVKNGFKKCNIEIWADNNKQYFFNMELAPSDPDWWAFLDLKDFNNADIEIKIDKLAAGSKALDNIHFSATEVKDGNLLYREEYRPQFHFSQKRGWNNDPNGLCYYNGEYHLFYQHNPYGRGWGNMHWGHAVSKDLIHWTELPVALYPDALGPMFSGSAVVDHNNTSGFGKADKAPLVLIYTAAGNPATQCIAYSNNGRTFRKYAGNPVVKNITGGNRDPKVIWHEPTQRWVMALYVGREKRHTTEFLISEDLKTWSSVSALKGGSRKHSRLLYECPDIFPLKVDGGESQRWITFGASLDYLIGNFDGTTFTPQTKGLPGCAPGSSIYAAQTYSDHPEGKRVLVGWLRADAPAMPFNQCMTIPQELGLKTTPAGIRLTHTPVKALESLRNEKQKLSAAKLTPADKFPLTGFPCREQEILIKAKLSFDAIINININDIEIGYLAAAETLIINGRKIKWSAFNGVFDTRIFCDRTSIEIFSGDGLQYGTYAHAQQAKELKTTVQIEEGVATDVEAVVYSLKSCWK